MPLTLGWKQGFYTYCLSLQAYWMRAIWYLYQTIFIYRATTFHWISFSTFYNSLESLKQKQGDCTISAKKFCVDFCTQTLKKILQIFLNIWIIWVKDFSKMYNVSCIAKFLFFANFFANLYFFQQLIEVESKGSKMYQLFYNCIS